MSFAAAASDNGGEARAPAWRRRLFVKFLALVASTFLAIIVPGMWLLLGFLNHTDEATLTARIGSLAARVSVAVERHRAYETPSLAHDLLSPLAADRAFLCAELLSADGPAVVLPRRQGCMDGQAASLIEVPVDDAGRWSLRVGFTGSELREARRLELLLGVSAIGLAFLAALVAGWLGFRFLVWRPLHLLTAAIAQASETGARRRVPWHSRDELGVVVEAYNGLVDHEAHRERELTAANDRLRTSEAALATLNRQLEQRVDERTRELEQARLRAEVANDTKTRFLWSMSHELRTPLNAIIGFSEIMTRGMFGPLENPRYQEFARDIHQSGRHLLEIINDLLDIARIEVGRDSLREQATPAAVLVEGCLRVVRPLADAKGITLHADCRDPRLTVLVDRTKLKQVLLNLLGNAIKNTPNDGRIAIEAERDGDGVAFRVADNGCGIAPEDIATALEPFGRVDAGLSQRTEGTGLGLPLARMMTELHGGELRLDSKVGTGTTVVVWLPASRIVEPERPLGLRAEAAG